MKPAQAFDVFNGDADGLLARHQFRLGHPPAGEAVTLITGVKRDIALLARVPVQSDPLCSAAINVFDISYDRNAGAAEALLAAGARLCYFDHHSASRLREHPRMAAHIDESPDTCSSLLVDRYCQGAYRAWAIAAAFGDNLATVARRLADEARLPPSQCAQLKSLGECLNYNAYGESLEDLYFNPADLAVRLQPYADPFSFIDQEDILPRLLAGYRSDLAQAMTVNAFHDSGRVAVYRLPDAAWSRRISGPFANHLVDAYPQQAHAVLTRDIAGNFTVSIRAPRQSPRDAAVIASAFPHGGGRAAAAGIESFLPGRLDELISAMEDTYR